jgi:hypothetical protein
VVLDTSPMFATRWLVSECMVDGSCYVLTAPDVVGTIYTRAHTSMA